MDVLLISASCFRLPTAQRAGAIVYEGTSDLGLWRPPGLDRDLLEVYGEELVDVLDKERRHLDEKPVSLGTALRMQCGRLSCDFLIWVAGRPPHGDIAAAPPPPESIVESLVHSALTLAADYHISRIAFGPIGAGRGERPAAERLASVVRAASSFAQMRIAAGRAPGIEEVLVCHPGAAAIAAAKRSVAHLARQPAAPKRADASSGSKAASGARRRRKTVPVAMRFTDDELTQARSSAATYDRCKTYASGEWFVHPHFGVGRVESVLLQRMVNVLFEDGAERKLIHER